MISQQRMLIAKQNEKIAENNADQEKRMKEAIETFKNHKLLEV